MVSDKPDYGGFPEGRNNLYLYISDFDDRDENWQSSQSWIHKAVAHAPATGLVPGQPADLRLQVLGGTIYCFYRPDRTSGTSEHNRWNFAFSYNAGHFGAGRFGCIGRGHGTIQWDALYPGRNHIDNVDNTVHFRNVEVTDAARDWTLQEVVSKYAWQGLTETEYRSLLDHDPDINVSSGSTISLSTAVPGSRTSSMANFVIDFKIKIASSGGEAGVIFRGLNIDSPGDRSGLCLGLVANSNYTTGVLVECYVKFYTVDEDAVDNGTVDYSPSPIHLKPNLYYDVRISVRNDTFTVYIHGNYIGHFHSDAQYGNETGYYTVGTVADFKNNHISELHEVPDFATLDPNQTMFDAIRKVIGTRHIKGVWRPYGKLLVSYFSWHDTSPTLQDTLRVSARNFSEHFYNVVEVVGAEHRATYINRELLERGRRYGQFHNPNLMTVEECYKESRLIFLEALERTDQVSLVGLPDIRLEPEDLSNIVVVQQNLNENFIIDDIDFAFDISQPASRINISGRKEFIVP